MERQWQWLLMMMMMMVMVVETFFKYPTSNHLTTIPAPWVLFVTLPAALNVCIYILPLCPDIRGRSHPVEWISGLHAGETRNQGAWGEDNNT